MHNEIYIHWGQSMHVCRTYVWARDICVRMYVCAGHKTVSSKVA